MKITLDIKEGSVSFFMELIKNLRFVKLLDPKQKKSSNIFRADKPGMGKKKTKEIYSPLDYSNYNFQTRNLKFDRGEINE